MHKPEHLRPLLASVSSTAIGRSVHPVLARSVPATAARPFVTISRQAGAGGLTLMAALLRRLNAMAGPQQRWAGYDQQLLEEVTERHGIAARQVDRMETDEPGWLIDLFETLVPHLERDPRPFQVYRKVVHTIRHLARKGHCVIVGRGGAQATADIAGGTHVRLVAPLHHRIANFARTHDVSEAAAADEVDRLDRARARFFGGFWGIDPIGSEHFHLTLNTARLSEKQLVDAVLAVMVDPAVAEDEGPESAMMGRF